MVWVALVIGVSGAAKTGLMSMALKEKRLVSWDLPQGDPNSNCWTEQSML